MARDSFNTAARAYFLYGVVYLIGGLYLVSHGIGARGSRVTASVEWAAIGLVLLFGIPYLLARRRMWFERWVLSRRDFARLLALLMAVRAWAVFRVMLRPETATVAAPWGGELSFRVGATVFFVITVAALILVARAAWQREIV
ncbi:MAG TPA: hypothetical protein VLG10_06280 [Methylomirabilota bacterium]|nr:hypothetical protein [Methylomirabilota bacterium]